MPLFIAAEYLGCPPWELLGRPQFWTICALTLAEARAVAERAGKRKQDIVPKMDLPPGYVSISDPAQLRAMGMVSE